MGRPISLVSCLVIAVLTAAPAFAQLDPALAWRPVDPAELALSAPKVQADADAEALFWDVRVSDEQSRSTGELSTIFDQYVRIKIFTDRGREAYATVNIPYQSGTDVLNVAARTIKPDGTIVELKSSEIFKRTTVKTDDARESVISFAAPALERGAILEYRWRELVADSLTNEVPLPFYREIPVHITRYFVRPLDNDAVDMKAMTFNGTFTPFARQRDGFQLATLSNVPATRDEPFATPEFDRGPWMLVYYDLAGTRSNRDVWLTFARALDEDYAKRTRPNDAIRRLAEEVPAGSVAERGAALMGLLLARVKRVDAASGTAGRTARDNRDAAEVLERGTGDGNDLTLLFLAVARAARLGARIAAAPDRRLVTLKPGMEHRFFLPGRLVALRDGTGWVLFDPANPESTTGSLRWFHEDVNVLVADAKTVINAVTPLSSGERSARLRNGTFQLLEDGTLEGEAQLSYTGHAAQAQRAQDIRDGATAAETSLRNALVARWPGADISSIQVQSLDDRSLPYVKKLKIRIPGYAQRAGSRLLFQPAVFQKGMEALFTAATRAGGLQFRYPWSERDLVAITLPAGFELEQPEAPPSLNVGAGTYTATLSRAGNTRIALNRTLAFGLGGAIAFEAPSYGAIKAFFDRVHASDAHTLVLRRQAVP